MKFKEFFTECHEKDVFKNLSIYIVSSWVLIQVFSVIWEPFGLPKISMTYLLLLLLVGFPLYVYLIWKFRLKPLELKVRSKTEGSKDLKRATSKSGTNIPKKKKIQFPGIHFYSPFQKMYFTSLFVISLMDTFTATLIIRANFLNKTSESVFNISEELENSNRIAVLNFENNTSDKNLDVIGKMAADWILHGITQNKVGQVISPKIVDDYSKVLKASIVPSGDNGILKAYLKPSKVVSGTYYVSKGQLLVQCSILDGNMNRTLVSFKVASCNPESPLDCIETIKQRILGYLITQNEEQIGYEETPPNFIAYKLWLDSKKYNYDEAMNMSLLNESIAQDNSFFKPKVDRISNYYNMDEFRKTDSLLQLLSMETGGNQRQKNMIEHYEALLVGDYRNGYETYKKEYNIEPFNLELNTSAMILALQFVNRPQDVDTIYHAFSMKDLDIDNCIQCEYRYFIQGMANLELGKVEETIELLSPFSRIEGLPWIKDALVKAYVINGNNEKVDGIIEHIKLVDSEEHWQSRCLKTANEYLRNGDFNRASIFYDLLINQLQPNNENLTLDERQSLAMALFYKTEYSKASKIFEGLVAKDQDDLSLLPYLGIALYKQGDISKSDRIIEALKQNKMEYQFGNVDYALAQFYAVAVDEGMMMDHLLKAVASGKRFTATTFQNDILFKPYAQKESFKKVLEFWN
ncbi:tetratricopeptide repeat protein [Eudoraea sp.]|uniref:tetratricopeptide repeat protein n=1 Tax=Eudoraea sp. TaxID=1979955 RepID=UPI003C738FE7